MAAPAHPGRHRGTTPSTRVEVDAPTTPLAVPAPRTPPEPRASRRDQDRPRQWIPALAGVVIVACLGAAAMLVWPVMIRSLQPPSAPSSAVAFPAATPTATVAPQAQGTRTASPSCPSAATPHCHTAGGPTASSSGSPGAVPTLGIPFDPGVRGYGAVRPREINNNGDGTSVISGVTWSSWGGARAVGTGTASWVAPGQASYQGAPQTATVIAWDLGTCGGHPAYRHVVWFFPQHGEHLDTGTGYHACTGS